MARQGMRERAVGWRLALTPRAVIKGRQSPSVGSFDQVGPAQLLLAAMFGDDAAAW